MKRRHQTLTSVLTASAALIAYLLSIGFALATRSSVYHLGARYIFVVTDGTAFLVSMHDPARVRRPISPPLPPGIDALLKSYGLRALALKEMQAAKARLQRSTGMVHNAERFAFPRYQEFVAKLTETTNHAAIRASGEIKAASSFGLWARSYFDSAGARIAVIGARLAILAIAATIIGTVLAFHFCFVRWKQRRRIGRCRACGYDLRASAANCPECGLAIEPIEAQTPLKPKK